MRRASLLLLFVLAACGDNTADPLVRPTFEVDAPPSIAPPMDASADAPPDAPPDALPPAPCIPSMTPADGATRVDPLAQLVVDFDAPVPAGTTVALYAPHATNPIPATITIAGCRLTVTPTYALDAWAVYRVRGAVTASFETVHDPWVKRVSVTQAGAITSGELHVIDADGNMIEQRAISSLGPDGLFGTPDDHLTYAARFEIEQLDATTMLVHQYVPGPDNLLNTPDDINNANTRYENDPALPYWRTFFLRADGTTGYFEERSFDADGKLAVFSIWSSTGADAMPFTDDDTLEVAYIVTPAATYTIDGSGLVGVTDLTRDAANRIVGSAQHEPGPDNRIDTPDDIVDQTFAYTYAPNGLWLEWRATSYGTVYHDDVNAYDARGNQLTQSDVAHGWANDIIYYQPLVAP